MYAPNHRLSEARYSVGVYQSPGSRLGLTMTPPRRGCFLSHREIVAADRNPPFHRFSVKLSKKCSLERAFLEKSQRVEEYQQDGRRGYVAQAKAQNP